MLLQETLETYLSIFKLISGSVSCTGNGGSAIGSSSSGNISGNFVAGHGASDYRILSNGSTVNVKEVMELIILVNLLP